MAEVCPKCLMSFPHHIVVGARCSKRWRGANFDQSAAEGNIGAALARLWGIDARTQEGLVALLERSIVRSYGERRDQNPTATFDPQAGEDFEFHVGLRFAASDDELRRVEQAARDAVAESRHFTLRHEQS